MSRFNMKHSHAFFLPMPQFFIMTWLIYHSVCIFPMYFSSIENAGWFQNMHFIKYDNGFHRSFVLAIV